MIARGGSYLKKDGKLTRVGGTEQPKAVHPASGGATSLPQAEAGGASASAHSGEKSTKTGKGA